MDEGDKIWVEQEGGGAAAAVYVGEAQEVFGGVPCAYVVYPETGEGATVELMRCVPRGSEET